MKPYLVLHIHVYACLRVTGIMTSLGNLLVVCVLALLTLYYHDGPPLHTQVAPTSWIGWFVYALITLVAFLVLKIVNIRLHLSLGSDPLPEPLPSEDTPPSDSEEQTLDDKGELIPRHLL